MFENVEFGFDSTLFSAHEGCCGESIVRTVPHTPITTYGTLVLYTTHEYKQGVES